MSTSNDTPDFITIQLTQGQVAIISPEDADLANLKWYAAFHNKYSEGGAYLAQQKQQGKTKYLHRAVLTRMLGRELLSKEQVDHINGDPLDNRRVNLRLATSAQNTANRSRHKNNKTGLKGVCFFRRDKKYVAHICVDGKRIHLGVFLTPEEAHAAYCEAAKELHGEFARFK